MKIIKLFGPPGTGKTTTLSESVRKAVNLRQDMSCTLIASLTNAAAKRIAGENLPVNTSLIGTLHALCYREMNHPPLVTKPKFIAEWNNQHPDLLLSSEKTETTPDHDKEEEGHAKQEEDYEGDRLQAQLSLLQHRLVPKAGWNSEIVHFYDLWTAYKKETGTCDFDDMILAGLGFTEAPMGTPLGIYDEVQDFSALEWSVVQHWAQFQEYVMVSGDDDQAIFSFRGADPKAFIDIPAVETRILNQSYRLPLVIQEYCEQWAQRISVRQPKEYAPRKDDSGTVIKGFLDTTSATYKEPEPILDIINESERNGHTTMILTACAYQLNNVVTLLRQEGIPFHNPWRPANGRWNPLASRGKHTAAQRIAAYLSPSINMRFSWTEEELQAWAPLMDAAHVFKRGAKKRIQEMGGNNVEVESTLLHELFIPEALPNALTGDTDWFFRHLTMGEKNNSALSFAFAIHERAGIESALMPHVSIGTIHSTKGAEANTVILFPDISPSGYEQWESVGEAQDTVLRQFYVGLSRAKDSLYLAEASSQYAVDWL